MKTVLIALCILAGCIDQVPEATSSYAAQSTSTETNLCNLNMDTCPGWAITLRGDAERNGKVWASAHYPGVAYHAPGTTCVSGPGWGSCEWHVDLGLVHVSYACIGDADDEGNLSNEVCDIVEVEPLLIPGQT